MPIGTLYLHVYTWLVHWKYCAVLCCAATNTPDWYVYVATAIWRPRPFGRL